MLPREILNVSKSDVIGIPARKLKMGDWIVILQNDGQLVAGQIFSLKVSSSGVVEASFGPDGRTSGLMRNPEDRVEILRREINT